MRGEGGPKDGVGEQWTFTERELAHAQEVARSRALQALQGAAAEVGERRAGPREPPKPVGLAEGLQLALFYAQKVPELCDLCDAPPDVRWTALTFYKRFFAVRSPMEFDPLPLMFACVHLACKAEEVHEITLDRLLEAADFGADKSLKSRVVHSELPLLEGLGFGLLVEPKPRAALQMLAGELRARCAQEPAKHHPTVVELPDEGWREALARAEGLAVELAARTDAVLLWPASIAIAAALGAALDAGAGARCAGGPPTPGAPFPESAGEAHGAGGALAPSRAVLGLLWDGVEAEAQQAVVRGMFEGAARCAARLALDQPVAEDAVRETARSARRCHRALERLKEAAAESSEVQRKERKRKWNETKGAAQRQVPTPLLRDLMDLNRKMQTSAGCAALGSDGPQDPVSSPPERAVAYD